MALRLKPLVHRTVNFREVILLAKTSNPSLVFSLSIIHLVQATNIQGRAIFGGRCGRYSGCSSTGREGSMIKWKLSFGTQTKFLYGAEMDGQAHF